MKTQKCLFFILILFLVSASFCFAQQSAIEAEELKPLMATVSISPDKAIYVGQRVEVAVMVLTDQWFGKAPIFSEFELPDTITIKPVNATINSSERIKGQSYAGQTQPYFIYPRQPGRYTIPPLTIRVVLGREKKEQIITSEEMSFEALIPKAALEAGVNELIATPKLQVEENLDKQPDSLKVGDALTRTIRMRVSDSLAMLLPPLSFEPIEGLGVYPAQPEVNDQAERGESRGTRLESVSYVMERAGTYQLPEIAIYWWDTTRGELKQEVLPAIDLEVEENPALAKEYLGGDQLEEEGTGEAEHSQLDITLKELALVVAAILVIVAFANMQPIRRMLIPWIRRKYSEYLVSETAMLVALRKACLNDDERETMNLLMRWLDYYGPERPIGILERYVEEVNDPEFARQTERLVHELYCEITRRGWQGKGLFHSLRKVRKKSLIKSHRTTLVPEEPVLTLNPESRTGDRTAKVLRNTK